MPTTRLDVARAVLRECAEIDARWQEFEDGGASRREMRRRIAEIARGARMALGAPLPGDEEPTDAVDYGAALVEERAAARAALR